MEVRADFRAFPAAGLAGEFRFDVAKPDVIRPSVAADRDRVAAPIIGAIDQETANAGGAHLGEGDLLAGRFAHADNFREREEPSCAATKMFPAETSQKVRPVRQEN
jgi:hypothetical protein